MLYYIKKKKVAKETLWIEALELIERFDIEFINSTKLF